METQQNNRYNLIILGIVIAIGLYLRFSGIVASPAELVTLLEQWYADYGYYVIFFAAMLEGLFVVSIYLPGSTAILLGVALASRNGLSVPLLVGLAILGFLVSYIINYCLGRYGLYRLLTRFGYGDALETSKASLQEKGPQIMLTTFFHPNLAAVITTGAGVIHMPFGTFLFWTALSVILWDTAWGIVGYIFGSQFLNILSSWWAIPLMIIWLLIVVVALAPKKNRSKAQRESTG